MQLTVITCKPFLTENSLLLINGKSTISSNHYFEMHLAYNLQLQILWSVKRGKIIKHKILPLILLNFWWQLNENLQDKTENGSCAMTKFSQVHCSHLDRSCHWHVLKMVRVQYSQVHCSHLWKIFRKFISTENGSCAIQSSPLFSLSQIQ